MMDFARRLAPVAATDATRAVAVLPSRFAGDSPVRADASAAQAEVSMPSSVVVAQPRTAPRVHAPRDTRVESDEPEAEAKPTELQPHPTRSHPAATPPRQRTVEGPMAPPRREPVSSPMRSEVFTPDTRAAAARAANLPDPAYEPSIGAIDISIAPQTTALSQPTLRRPLSDAALAARSTPPPQQTRPIVHVTIDRIEVRAPAAPSRPAPAAPQRTAAPSVSLNDYLRQRTPQRGGTA